MLDLSEKRASTRTVWWPVGTVGLHYFYYYYYEAAVNGISFGPPAVLLRTKQQKL